MVDFNKINIARRHEEVRGYIIGELEKLGCWVCNTELTGSAAFGKVDPADYDVLVLVGRSQHELRDILLRLEASGWYNCAEDSANVSDKEKYGYGDRIILRKGDMNVQIYSDVWEYVKGLAASLVVKRLIDDGMFAPYLRGDHVKAFRILRGES